MSSTPAFYINLDSRPDRREHTEHQLARVGIEAERISAVTPADIDPDTIAAASRHMSATELACSYSHRKIWRMMLERGLTGALVMEDDVLLSRSFPEAVEAARRAGCDAVHFESHPKTSVLLGPPVSLSSGVAIHRLMSSSLGTGAYYITTDFAAQILARNDLDTLAVDRILFGRGGGIIYTARIYQTVPALAAQLGLFTSLTSGPGRSDLHPARAIKSHRRGIAKRLAKIRLSASHLGRIVTSFAPTGELFRGRQLTLPIADDIKAQIQALLPAADQ